ncbi:MAG TPA: hypothetical protein PLP11_02915 [Bacteroidales bacterium]|nr:hypothetical protein [Bacteroidales bacterium]
MKKLYFSLLSLMLISVVGFAQVSKPLVSHAKQADARSFTLLVVKV